MTIKLYEKNVYLKECESEITEVIEDNGYYLIKLDQTIFFPEGGGQNSDIGYMDDCEVFHTFEKNGSIYHKTNKKPNKNKVLCRLNWERRLDGMQQHCGEHILSGIIMKEYGGVNKGFHMGKELVTIDIDLPNMTDDMVENIEIKGNEAIYENVQVQTFTVNTKEEAGKHALRKEPTVDHHIRIVKIDGIDSVACCGTHPQKTGDVGIIKIHKAEKYKGMTRIYFQCGMRALKNLQTRHKIMTKIFQKYSADEATILEKLKIEENKNNELKNKLKELRNIVSENEADRIIAENTQAFIIKSYENKSIDELRLISKRVLEKDSKMLLFISKDNNTMLLVHNGSYSIHLGKIVGKWIKAFNGKGGGGNQMAQGVFENNKDLDMFIDKIKKEIII